ncbi:hypothetical protein PoB_005054700 [Plakobranchus ocellatus]|uniref:Uncharacterized protein n=1 Tax=Plakobranchus ocellatus TaxID=259542 RepID=A0AAV4BXI8_9GAST|nr:hypothetical protein PoB_005054700 [Plakobranchus ocellatus]
MQRIRRNVQTDRSPSRRDLAAHFFKIPCGFSGNSTVATLVAPCYTGTLVAPSLALISQGLTCQCGKPPAKLQIVGCAARNSHLTSRVRRMVNKMLSL